MLDISQVLIIPGRLSFTISDSTVQGTFTPSRRIANNSARDSFSEEMVANLESLLRSVLASGSGQSYRRAWTLFREFHEKFYKTKAFHLPLTTASLALFISFLDGRNLLPSTILTYLSAIGYVHKMKGLHDPTKAFLIQKLLTSLSRQKSCDVRFRYLNLFCMTSYVLSSTPILRQHSVYFFQPCFPQLSTVSFASVN